MNFAIVPVKKFENAKTRLSSILTLEERIMLSSLMLERTLGVLEMVSEVDRILLVSTDRRAEQIGLNYDTKFLHEETESGVNSAVMLADSYSTSERADTTVVIPQDLPLLNQADVSMVCKLALNDDRCIVICPSQRYDGTNALLRKPPSAIRTFYDSNSYESHIAEAASSGVQTRIFLSKNLMSDVDTPDDVKQIMRDDTGDDNKVIDFLKSKLSA
ncbi:MAG: 2-phospho-L-lactate guanylyltransferase [Nitrososphaera sp.]